jgi:osmotically-inducible protein OsmY
MVPNDSELQGHVLAEIKWCPSVDSAHIGVTANHGVVTLTGQVAHYTEKMAVEAAAKGVYGVKGIASEIKVHIPGSSRRTDEDVAVAAVNALKWDFEVPHDHITISVTNGLLTLEGSVDWQYQKDAAERCTRYLMGVAALSNLIAVKPTMKWVDVKDKIKDTFRRN